MNVKTLFWAGPFGEFTRESSVIEIITISSFKLNYISIVLLIQNIILEEYIMKLYGVGRINIDIEPSQRGLYIGDSAKPKNYTIRDEFNALVQCMMGEYMFSDELLEELDIK